MKQVVSILLSLLLLASSSGIAYAQHFCGDYEMLSRVTLGTEHLSCGMKMEVPPCKDNDSEEHHCCSNEYTQVDTDDNFVTVSFDMQLDQNFVAAFVSVFVLLQVADYHSNSNFYTDYGPPPLERDIQVWNQVFII